MGAWYESILIRTEDADSVQRTLREIANETDGKFLAGPSVNGWTSVFPSVTPDVAADFAPRLAFDVFHLLVHDDDVFIYDFYRGGRLVDHYISRPDYSEDFSEQEIKESRGKPELWRDLLRDPEAFDQLKILLGAEKDFVFESERMSEFVELLGLENALSSYEYLKSGERDGINAWDKFVHLEGQPETAADFNSRGNRRRAANQLDGALQDFDRAIALKPDFAEGYHNRGLARIFQNEVAEALGEAARSEARFAGAFNQPERAKEAEENRAGALADFNKAIELKPDWSEPYLNRANLRKKQGDFAGELADYQKIIELQAATAAIYNSCGEAKRQLGDLAGALADYEKAMALEPTFALAYNNRGRLKREAKDWDKAMADYTRAIELDPGQSDFYNNRSLAKRSKGDLAGALADLEKAIELNPDSAVVYANRGEIKRSQGDLDGAIADYTRTIERDPNHFGAFNFRAEAKRAKGDAAGSLADFNRAVELQPGSATIRNNRGELKRSTGDWEGAMEDYNKAIELQPGLAVAYNNRGEAKRAKKDLDGALADYDKALELAPEMAAAHNNRGLTRWLKKDLPGAMADLTRAVQLNPRVIQFHCNLADVKRLQKKWDEAIEDYNRALELRSDWAEAWYGRAEANRGKGELERAILDYDRAIALRPNSAVLHNNRGVAKRAKNDLKGARDDFKKAVELKPDLAEARKNLEEAFRNLEPLETHPIKAKSARTGSFGTRRAKIPATENTPALRTDFSDDAKWKSLCAAMQNPEADFTANVDFISDRQYEGVTPGQLPALLPEGSPHVLAFILDGRALNEPEHPVLVVDLQNEPGRSFRVIVSALWEVENNLSVGNMDFEEFLASAGEDGVYRGSV